MNRPHIISFTKEGYEKLQKEEDILREQRKDAVEHLKKAREMGDLSENGYYKAAKARLSSIDHQIQKVHYLLRFGKIVDSLTDDAVHIGNAVTITSGDQERQFMIVGEHEANPSESKISVRSPLGSAILGKKKGETFSIETPRGNKVYKILTIQ